MSNNLLARIAFAVNLNPGEINVASTGNESTSHVAGKTFPNDDRHGSCADRADIKSGAYERWMIDRAYLLVPTQAVVGQFLATFRDLPPPEIGVVQRGSGIRNDEEEQSD
jgi:hypothetical protein